jgi:uncharacterized protein (DUF427 family)
LYESIRLHQVSSICGEREEAPVARAIWNGKVIAESDDFEVVEGNVYFPPSALKREFFNDSEHRTTCIWKGQASYYSVEVNGETNRDAAWFYPAPKSAAANIKDYVAFWRGVTVER